MDTRTRTDHEPTLRDVRDAQALMADFVARTEVGREAGPRHRYLWTDAFAVCNLLALHARVGDATLLATARALVDDVHEGLGRHHPLDERKGWLSGMPDQEARRHPTVAGLRIGKPEPERGPSEPLDRVREWDRDGQYFHYLTRWMHALSRTSTAMQDQELRRCAVELAEAAQCGFVTGAPGRRRMAWKMSVALDRVLVPEMGQHDPIDGMLTCLELRATLRTAEQREDARRLDEMLEDMRAMAAHVDWTVEDPLGIGCLLCGAGWLAQLTARGAVYAPGALPRLLEGALHGLDEIPPDFFEWSTAHRLGFRELGLAIGLAAVPRIVAAYEVDRERLGGPAMGMLLARVERHLPLGHRLVECWRDPASHVGPAWQEHRDINDVMLATALVPEGYLAV